MGGIGRKEDKLDIIRFSCPDDLNVDVKWNIISNDDFWTIEIIKVRERNFSEPVLKGFGVEPARWSVVIETIPSSSSDSRGLKTLSFINNVRFKSCTTCGHCIHQ